MTLIHTSRFVFAPDSKPRWVRRRRLVSIAIVTLVTYTGCGSENGSMSAGDRQAKGLLRMLGLEYASYLAAHDDSPPKDAHEMKRFLASKEAELKSYHVSSVDELLTSPRDGQPLIIVTGKKISHPSRDTLYWVAYEQTGIGGTRLACDTRGGVVELTSDEIVKQIKVR